MNRKLLQQAAIEINNSSRVVAFTGAGISVESGIPPFRGPEGLWSHYNPEKIEIGYFLSHPEVSWITIKEIFYDYFGKAEPNPAHLALADLENLGILHCVITQNIDHLHQDAGNKNVIEYHGTSRRLICTKCQKTIPFSKDILNNMPPRCKSCQGILKPDFVFFGEAIPIDAVESSINETKLANVWLVIGTSGEIYPACSLPIEAKQNGKTIIEININPSSFTDTITDIFLQGKASEVTQSLLYVLTH